MSYNIIFILLSSLIFFILEYFILSYLFLEKKNSYYLTFFYIFQSLIILLLLHFNWGKNFFYLLLKDMNKNIILRDPQDLLYILMNSSFYLLLIVSFWLIIFYFNLRLLNLFRENEYLIYKLFICFLFYSFILSFILFSYDLNSFHWEIFYQDKTFDFQPELTKWYFFYKGEFIDLLMWLCLIFLFYFLVLLFPSKIAYKNNFFYRILPFMFLLIFSLYFLGGESLWRDFWLIFCSFILGEMYIFLILFLAKIQKYKLK